MLVGVLALQGDFREHLAMLDALEVNGKAVKTAEEINAIDGLIIPGGESTTLSKLAKAFDLFDLLKSKIQEGLPTYGSCAGMIMLADEIIEPASGQQSFGGIPMKVKRNAFGSQVESFEEELAVKGLDSAYRGVFIRAPWVEQVSDQVEVLATVNRAGEDHPVMVAYRNCMATSFHPEITSDTRIHEYFLKHLVRNC
jgi:5'-phosphate synthase pdxT subunit